MTSLTQRRRPHKPRSICWLSKPVAGRIGSLQITADRMTVGYWCRLLPSDFGRAVELTNWVNDETYAVCLDGDKSSCECLGFLRRGHCKHVSGMQALLASLPAHELDAAFGPVRACCTSCGTDGFACECPPPAPALAPTGRPRCVHCGRPLETFEDDDGRTDYCPDCTSYTMAGHDPLWVDLGRAGDDLIDLSDL